MSRIADNVARAAYLRAFMRGSPAYRRAVLEVLAEADRAMQGFRLVPNGPADAPVAPNGAPPEKPAQPIVDAGAVDDEYCAICCYTISGCICGEDPEVESA